MNLKYIRELAAEQMMQRRSHPAVELGNKYFHGQRVGNTVIELRKQLFPNHPEWDETLLVAAWFHDIANDRTNPELDHQQAGADMTAAILKNVCLAEEVEQICSLIACHDMREPGNASYSDQARLLQDADLLDHLGIFDIWYIFSMAATQGLSMPELFEWFEQTRPGKEELYYYQCNFALSQRILLEKSKFVYDFGARYLTEGNGQIWHLEEMTKQWREQDGGKLYGTLRASASGETEC
ncbi:MAG: HD domain-containing protein [Lachnospiraceae bacterium]|nr:HD domain-containing protein [Lachnospiraceae bacterium]